MKEKQLSKKDYIFISSMLFGLFFGAGNLIFPVFVGQQSGQNVWISNLGFLVAGVGLPFLGVISIGLSKSRGVFELASKVNRVYGIIFTMLLYLTIGPLFAGPRAATIPFEIGFAPHIKASQEPGWLLLFSILFFTTVWLLAVKPTKILVYVGKYLNPIFLCALAILLLFVLINPMGNYTDFAATSAYQKGAFMSAFGQGYYTMDALAGLAFGIIIVDTIHDLGVTDSKSITKGIVRSGSISVILMGIIYTCLAYLGATSLGLFSHSDNGGAILAQVTEHYFGKFGSLFLAAIIVVACIKTAIGVTSAFAKICVEIIGRGSYILYLTLGCVVSCLIANVGLDQLISLSTPVLMLLYPLAIVLMIVACLEPVLNKFDFKVSIMYQWLTVLTFFSAIFDGLNAMPTSIKNLAGAKRMLSFADNYLPLFNIGLSWMVPVALGLVMGLIFMVREKRAK
ncbi:branched-chain amino acid transport system II carrier protein [Dellaglioa sp. L3N]